MFIGFIGTSNGFHNLCCCQWITVASTIGPHGTAYGKIMRYTAELFLDWLNLERPIPGTDLIGGLMVGGRRYSMRYVWAGDESADTAAAAVAHYLDTVGLGLARGR